MTVQTKNHEHYLGESKRLLGENILHYRELRQISQEKLANLAQLGVSHLGNIERGNTKMNPTFETLVKIAKALQVSVEDLVEGTFITPEAPAEPQEDNPQ